MKDELIKVISDYLKSETNLIDLGDQMWVQFGGALNSGHFTHTGFCQEIAAEIAGKVLEVVEQKTGWEDAPEWAEYRTTDNDGDVTYWEYRPICSLLGIWLQSADGGRFSTIPLNRGELEERPK